MIAGLCVAGAIIVGVMGSPMLAGGFLVAAVIITALG